MVKEEGHLSGERRRTLASGLWLLSCAHWTISCWCILISNPPITCLYLGFQEIFVDKMWIHWSSWMEQVPRLSDNYIFPSKWICRHYSLMYHCLVSIDKYAYFWNLWEIDFWSQQSLRDRTQTQIVNSLRSVLPGERLPEQPSFLASTLVLDDNFSWSFK